MPIVRVLNSVEAQKLATGVEKLFAGKGLQKEKLFYKSFPYVKTTSAKLSLTTAEGRAAADKILKAIESYYQSTSKEKKSVLSSELSEDELQFIEREWQRHDEAKLARYLETSARLAWMLQVSFKDHLKSGSVDPTVLKIWKDIYQRAGWKGEEIDILERLLLTTDGEQWSDHLTRLKALQLKREDLSADHDTLVAAPVCSDYILNLIARDEVLLRVVRRDKFESIIKEYQNLDIIFFDEGKGKLRYEIPETKEKGDVTAVQEKYLRLFLFSGKRKFTEGFTMEELEALLLPKKKLVIRKDLSDLRTNVGKQIGPTPLVTDARETKGVIRVNPKATIAWYMLPKKTP